MTVSVENKKQGGIWVQKADELGRRFAERAADHDTSDRFVAENFKDLKDAKMFSAHVPEELGGGGASYQQTAEMLRALAHHCGSTALAFSMHNHLVAALVWRWKNQKAPVEPLLKRIAAEQAVLVTSGGSDWLNGSGTAKKVDGGYAFTGRKIFASGSPLGDVMMTMGIVQDGSGPANVIHFPLSFKAPELKVIDTWRVMGMRGTGSNEIDIQNIFVPEGSVGVTRPQGKWHPSMHVVAKVAIPLIYCVYTGLAEAARDIAVQQCIKKRANPDIQTLIGELENELGAARLACEAAVELGISAVPGDETTNRVMICRALIVRAVLQVANKAMEVVGGAAYFRSLSLERIFRDLQAARYHPLTEKPQTRYAGRLALGLPVDEDR